MGRFIARINLGTYVSVLLFVSSNSRWASSLFNDFSLVTASSSRASTISSKWVVVTAVRRSFVRVLILFQINLTPGNRVLQIMNTKFTTSGQFHHQIFQAHVFECSHLASQFYTTKNHLSVIKAITSFESVILTRHGWYRYTEKASVRLVFVNYLTEQTVSYKSINSDSCYRI